MYGSYQRLRRSSQPEAQRLEKDALYSLEGTNQVYSGAELMYAGLTVVLPSGRFPH